MASIVFFLFVALYEKDLKHLNKNYLHLLISIKKENSRFRFYINEKMS